MLLQKQASPSQRDRQTLILDGVQEELRVGMRVDVFRRSQRPVFSGYNSAVGQSSYYYKRGTVAAINRSGSHCMILYEDGSSESRVSSAEIRPLADSQNAVPHLANSINTEIQLKSPERALK